MARFRVSAEFTVAGDRDPNVWDWETILGIEDESDRVDWSTFMLERVADGDDYLNARERRRHSDYEYDPFDDYEGGY